MFQKIDTNILLVHMLCLLKSHKYIIATCALLIEITCLYFIQKADVQNHDLYQILQIIFQGKVNDAL